MLARLLRYYSRARPQATRRRYASTVIRPMPLWSMEEVARTATSVTYRNARVRQVYGGRLLRTPDNNDSIDNLKKLFERGMAFSPTATAVSSFEYADTSSGQPQIRELSFEQMYEQAMKLGRALQEGICTTNIESGQKHVGVYLSNCPTFCCLALACAFHRTVLVTLYDTLGADSSIHILNEAGLELLFIDDTDKLEKIYSIVAGNRSTVKLRTVVIVNEQKELKSFKDRFIKHSIELQTLQEFLDQYSTNNVLSHNDPVADDLYTVQYTSGTTGTPKGVTISHGNLLADVAGLKDALDAAECYQKPPDRLDSVFSYLPFAHIYPVIMAFWYWYIGASLVVSNSGANFARMLSELRLSQCSYLPLVPRTVNRLNDCVTTAVAQQSPEQQKCFFDAFERVKTSLQTTTLSHADGDSAAVFRPYRALIGGNVRLMCSSAAPVSPAALESLRVVFGVYLPELYGQTEMSGGSLMQLRPDIGSVGIPLSSHELKVADCPQLNISVEKDNAGELCLRGGSLMKKGYFAQPEMTKENLDSDGFFLSGDVGKILVHLDHSIKIIDRSKHIFKLQQGEYVAPEKIEQVYVSHDAVAQIFVDGRSDQTYLVAVVVPDHEALAAKGITASDSGSTQQLLLSMREFGKQRGLSNLEQVKSVHLHLGEPFSPANDLLSPSLKAKRRNLAKYFAKEIDQMYSRGPMV